MRCNTCLESVDHGLVFCPSCGRPLGVAASPPRSPIQPAESKPERSRKSRDTALLLALIPTLLFGVAGIHRFYTGRIGTGILQLLTWGGLLVWLMFDVIDLAHGRYRDRHGQIVEIKPKHHRQRHARACCHS